MFGGEVGVMIMVAVFCAIFVKAALDKVAQVLRQVLKQPDAELSWLALVAIAAGAALSWFLGLNVFPFIANPLIGQILTAVAVGLGADFLNEMMTTTQGRAEAFAEPRALVVGSRPRVRGW